MRQNKYEYDAFISHAVEDKIPIANDLCARLERKGLRVWYSGKELGIGDSIEKTIERGLNRSRYGIVILSPTYLAKNWTIREFYTLLAKEIEDRKVILPVLFNVTPDDLKERDLHMADRFAVNADRGLDYVVDRLVREIRKPEARKLRVPWLSGVWTLLVFSLMANLLFLIRDFTAPYSYHDRRNLPERIVPAGFAMNHYGDSRENNSRTIAARNADATMATSTAEGQAVTVSFVFHVAPGEASRVYQGLGEVLKAVADTSPDNRTAPSRQF